MALTDNLISYWKLDEASGNALDAHGSNTLTDTNTVGTATGKIGNARDFEAGNVEYFTINDNASLSTGDIDFTISCWIQFESLGADRVILGKWAVGSLEYSITYIQTAFGSGSASQRLHVSVSGNGSAFIFLPANNFGALSTATWYFVVVWHDSVNNVLGISINGTADTASYSSGVFNGTAKFRIGGQDVSGSESPHDGLIDEVGFWKRVLTSDERTQLYNSGNGLSYDSFGSASPVGPLRGGKLLRGILTGGRLVG